MNPEDRVLVAVMNRPADFEIARDRAWYRVPEKHATPGIYFEYVAFYFTGAFPELKWGIYYYAPILGHELVTRRDVLPAEADHPRAGERYYKLALGPLVPREPPILSRTWRRVTFIHTTWDRFETAAELNDLFIEGGPFVDRLYHTLREAGLAPERCYPVREAGADYVLDLAVPCRAGVLGIDAEPERSGLPGALVVTPDAVAAGPDGWLALIRAEIEKRGGRP